MEYNSYLLRYSIARLEQLGRTYCWGVETSIVPNNNTLNILLLSLKYAHDDVWHFMLIYIQS